MKQNDLPLYFLPGLLSTPSVWEWVRQSLQQIFGHPYPAQIRAIPNDSSISKIASDLLDELPERFGLIGHSMGGYIALEAYAMAPDRFGLIGLCNTSPFEDIKPVRDYRETLIAAVDNGDFDKVMGELIDALVGNSGDSDGSDAAAMRYLMRQMAMKIGPDQFSNNVQAILNRKDHSATVNSIGCPCLIVSSTNDRSVSPKAAPFMAEHVKGSTLLELAGCGHMGPIEAPELIAGAIAQLVRNAER